MGSQGKGKGKGGIVPVSDSVTIVVETSVAQSTSQALANGQQQGLLSAVTMKTADARALYISLSYAVGGGPVKKKLPKKQKGGKGKGGGGKANGGGKASTGGGGKASTGPGTAPKGASGGAKAGGSSTKAGGGGK